MRFGAAVGIGTGSFGSEAYRDLLRAECGVLVCENEMKAYAVRATPDRYAFEEADSLVAFATGNRLDMRGHTLLWNHPRWLPDWLKSHRFADAAEARAFISDFIERVGGRYQGRILSWDVVNETIDEDGQMRQTPFTQALGDEAIDFAFHQAQALLPDTELVYNDYMIWNRASGAHRLGVLRLLESFRTRGVPCDALGIQSHLGGLGSAEAIGSAFDEQAWRAFLDEVTGMGYRLLITELDVNDRSFPSEPSRRDAEIAAYVKAYLDLVLSYEQMGDVIAWGLCDRFSWLSEPKFGGSEDSRPTPYDRDFKPKPMRDAIAAAFRAAPARTPVWRD